MVTHLSVFVQAVSVHTSLLFLLPLSFAFPRLPDSNSDKENSHSRSLSSARRHLSHSHTDGGSSGSTHRRFDYVELSPVATPTNPGSTTQREAGEGQVRESGSWREEEQTREATSQWEAVLSRKGPGQGGDSRQSIEQDIERKWAEFERLPLKEMRSLPATGSRSTSGQMANEALQREVVREDDFFNLLMQINKFIC